MTVTFCGHSEVPDADGVKDWLRTVVLGLIGQGATLFYSGGYGGFDRLVAGVLRELKPRFPQIQSVLVLAYLDRAFDGEGYDSTYFPSLETVPKRFAIVRRNQRMVDESDVVVAYVTYPWGGAAKTLEYAKKRSKRGCGQNLGYWIYCNQFHLTLIVHLLPTQSNGVAYLILILGVGV